MRGIFRHRSRSAVLGALLILAVATTACSSGVPTGGIYANISTSKGLIVVTLEFEKTPLTVANFVGLAEGTIQNDALPPGAPFFDGSTFHRVVPGHVIQGGIPNSPTARGSGRTIPNEIHPDLSHRTAGMLGMASAGPHTATNQWYITLGDRSYLDGNYAVFGEVVAGLDVAMSIEADDTIDSVRIVRMGEAAEAFRADDETFVELLRTVEAQVAGAELQKQRTEETWVQDNWPDASTTESGLRYVSLNDGVGRRPTVGDTIAIRYTAQSPGGMRFVSSDSGNPAWPLNADDSGKTFQFTVGVSSINPGFDEAVTQMLSNARRVVILPAALAYAVGGYYAPEKEGEKRLVISPNTLIVYDIEVLD